MADWSKNVSYVKKRRASFSDYVAIARLDHSTKHVFIIPGAILAFLLRGNHEDYVLWHVVLGICTAICIASANYVINEWLDRDFDKHHPTKSRRKAVQAELRPGYVLIEWFVLVAVGLASAALSNRSTLIAGVLFAAQGVVYNVPPLRTKDKAYLDVLSESINNPLRLLIGWAMVDGTTLPPSSIILTYWSGGAFLMAAKRLSEYRQIVTSHGKALLVRYRASFAVYTEETLVGSCLGYSLCSIFFLAVFLLKYRIEYILMVPIVILLFSIYATISIRPDFVAQRPERLLSERSILIMIAALCIGFFVLSFVDLPILSSLTSQRYIDIP